MNEEASEDAKAELRNWAQLENRRRDCRERDTLLGAIGARELAVAVEAINRVP
jgi:hypothetical protein